MNKIADALARAVRMGLVSEQAAGRVTQELGLKSRFIRDLGLGAEGLVQLRTSPKHKLMATKLYDTRGMYYSQKMLKLKELIAKKAYSRYSNLFSKPLGIGERPNIYHSEYVLPKKGTYPGKAKWNKIEREIGITDASTNENNILHGRVIDFMPRGTDLDTRRAKLNEAQKKLFELYKKRSDDNPAITYNTYEDMVEKLQNIRSKVLDRSWNFAKARADILKRTYR